MKKIFCLAVMILAMQMFSVQCEAARHLIIDTDMGGDDATALLLAAKAPNVTIEGVTVLAGNVSLEQAARNALMTLEVADAKIPVYKGAERSLVNREVELFSVYGKDGMGDANLIHPKTKEQKKSAVDFILETVKKYPDEVEIVMLGPATNIALAIEKDLETMRHVKRFWSMGTAGFGPGNATPVSEFNVFKDAEAYKVMLDLDAPITIIGWDIANNEKLCFNRKILDEMKKSSPAQKFIAVANEKYFSFCHDLLKSETAPISDAVLMAGALWDDFILESVPCHASCITAEGETYGQVIFYRKDYNYDTMITFDNYSVEVVTKVRDDKFFSRYRDTVR